MERARGRGGIGRSLRRIDRASVDRIPVGSWAYVERNAALKWLAPFGNILLDLNGSTSVIFYLCAQINKSKRANMPPGAAAALPAKPLRLSALNIIASSIAATRLVCVRAQVIGASARPGPDGCWIS